VRREPDSHAPRTDDRGSSTGSDLVGKGMRSVWGDEGSAQARGEGTGTRGRDSRSPIRRDVSLLARTSSSTRILRCTDHFLLSTLPSPGTAPKSRSLVVLFPRRRPNQVLSRLDQQVGRCRKRTRVAATRVVEEVARGLQKGIWFVSLLSHISLSFGRRD